jgi:hydrophobe/amphiphile efflux-3 (HAE3) family protein
MIKDRFYSAIVRHPWIVIAVVVVLTVYFALQIPKLEWETDARVYLPHGDPAIKYDEKVEKIFGVKDALIIGIVNEKKGVFNPVTLEKIARLTKEVAALPGVVANRTIDVASLSTASVFYGTDTEVGSKRLMEEVPKTPEDIEKLKKLVYENSDLLVGNIVSQDGHAAMIRAKLKEGKDNRYQAYFQLRGILAGEYGATNLMQGQDWSGGGGQWGSGNWQKNQGGGSQQGGNTQWQGSNQQQGGNAQWQGGNNQRQGGNGQWQGGYGGQGQGSGAAQAEDNGDVFYIAGRPAIEVTSGLSAIKDIKVMAMLLLAVIMAMLFFAFRTGRGVFLPTFVMSAAIIWTMGIMAVMHVPLYTISTMLPVILAAVGIGDAIHLLSSYYDNALTNPQGKGGELILQALNRLSAPLMTTSLTTAAGFMSLLFAEMPPFRIFGLFTVLGIFISWLLTVTFIPAVLTLLRPKVGGYLMKRKMMRVYNESGWCSRLMVNLGDNINSHRAVWGFGLVVVAVLFLYGSSRIFVDSSWMSDFKKDSEIAVATDVLNRKFDGTIFLNVVIEGREKDALKSPVLLKKIEQLQDAVEKDPYVGDSLSIVDYLKSMNKTFHSNDERYDVLPDSQKQIAEYLYLFSISGRPEQLDEVVDFDYRRANVNFMVKTDHTRILKRIIDKVNGFVKDNFQGIPADVNLAGSANNSYVWAALLIKSQTTSIIISKLAILVIATLLFRSLLLGLITVVPVTMTTLLVAGYAGFARIPLDVSTALAAGLAIGVGVDYTIHFIHRYLYERRAGSDHSAATAATMRTVGRTIAYNAVIVAAGFSVLLLSEFPPNVKLGEFVAAYMLLSLVAALVTLPILLAYKRVSIQGPRE